MGRRAGGGRRHVRRLGRACERAQSGRVGACKRPRRSAVGRRLKYRCDALTRRAGRPAGLAILRFLMPALQSGPRRRARGAGPGGARRRAARRRAHQRGRSARVEAARAVGQLRRLVQPPRESGQALARPVDRLVWQAAHLRAQPPRPREGQLGKQRRAPGRERQALAVQPVARRLGATAAARGRRGGAGAAGGAERGSVSKAPKAHEAAARAPGRVGRAMHAAGRSRAGAAGSGLGRARGGGGGRAHLL